MCSKEVAGAVSAEPGSAQPGSVRALGDGLFVGVIDRMGAAKGYWDIAFDDWAAICRRVSEMQPAS